MLHDLYTYRVYNESSGINIADNYVCMFLFRIVQLLDFILDLKPTLNVRLYIIVHDFCIHVDLNEVVGMNTDNKYVIMFTHF